MTFYSNKRKTNKIIKTTISGIRPTSTTLWMGARRWFLPSFCCCLHFFTLGFSTYWITDKWVDAKPYEHDVQIGKKYFNQVQKQGIVYPGDQPMQKLVSKTCQDLVKNVDPSFRDAVPFTFNVIRRDDSNAFSVPGGFIFFHDDLLDDLSVYELWKRRKSLKVK